MNLANLRRTASGDHRGAGIENCLVLFLHFMKLMSLSSGTSQLSNTREENCVSERDSGGKLVCEDDWQLSPLMLLFPEDKRRAGWCCVKTERWNGREEEWWMMGEFRRLNLHRNNHFTVNVVVERNSKERWHVLFDEYNAKVQFLKCPLEGCSKNLENLNDTHVKNAEIAQFFKKDPTTTTTYQLLEF